MRRYKLWAVALVIILPLSGTLGCGSKPDEAGSQTPVVELSAEQEAAIALQRRLEAEIELRTGSTEWESDDVAAAEQRLRTVERRILSTQAKRDSAKADVADLLDTDNNASDR